MSESGGEDARLPHGRGGIVEYVDSLVGEVEKRLAEQKFPNRQVTQPLAAALQHLVEVVEAVGGKRVLWRAPRGTASESRLAVISRYLDGPRAIVSGGGIELFENLLFKVEWRQVLAPDLLLRMNCAIARCSIWFDLRRRYEPDVQVPWRQEHAELLAVDLEQTSLNNVAKLYRTFLAVSETMQVITRVSLHAADKISRRLLCLLGQDDLARDTKAHVLSFPLLHLPNSLGASAISDVLLARPSLMRAAFECGLGIDVCEVLLFLQTNRYEYAAAAICESARVIFDAPAALRVDCLQHFAEVMEYVPSVRRRQDLMAAHLASFDCVVDAVLPAADSQQWVAALPSVYETLESIVDALAPYAHELELISLPQTRTCGPRIAQQIRLIIESGQNLAPLPLMGRLLIAFPDWFVDSAEELRNLLEFLCVLPDTDTDSILESMRSTLVVWAHEVGLAESWRVADLHRPCTRQSEWMRVHTMAGLYCGYHDAEEVCAEFVQLADDGAVDAGACIDCLWFARKALQLLTVSRHTRSMNGDELRQTRTILVSLSASLDEEVADTASRLLATLRALLLPFVLLPMWVSYRRLRRARAAAPRQRTWQISALTRLPRAALAELLLQLPVQ